MKAGLLSEILQCSGLFISAESAMRGSGTLIGRGFQFGEFVVAEAHRCQMKLGKGNGSFERTFYRCGCSVH